MKRQVFARPHRGRTATNAKGLNKAEAAYALHLETLKRAGLVDNYRMMPGSFRLTTVGQGERDSFYRPDALVVRYRPTYDDDGAVVELHECKASNVWTEQALERFQRAAADLPWFRFVSVSASSKRGVYTFTETVYV